MIYDWYKIFNLVTFRELEMVSQNLLLDMEGLGQKEILVTNGNYTCVTYEGVLLPIGFNGHNPFEFDSLAVLLDANNDVWLGILNES